MLFRTLTRSIFLLKSFVSCFQMYILPQQRPSTLIRGSFSGYTEPQTKDGAYEIAKSSTINFPCIILVNPFLDANVGSVSRAMLNFGLTDLRVVDPNCDIRSEHAMALAAGSRDVLHNAKIFPTLESATQDLTRIMATTIRTRHMTQVYFIFYFCRIISDIYSWKMCESVDIHTICGCKHRCLCLT